ncbi:MAG: very short patch repair endonuclease [Thaumarchaeota archaeon]|nr:very short patch repair endonuclease [Nitrososphaerota archaeon]
MADIFTKEKRSWVMSQIRGKDTKIEKKMGKILSDNRIKFVQHPQMLGNPDFRVGKYTVLFCDGDFWHGYNYEKKKRPAKKFWKDKIERNMTRDRKITRRLRRDGYSVLRFWEHDIERRPEMCINRIMRFMR